MMTRGSWLFASGFILVLLIVLVVIAIVSQRRSKRPPDYRTLFIAGVMWLVIGIPVRNFVMAAVGLVLAVLGIAHRKEWKQASTNWSELTREEKRTKIFLIAGIGVVFLMAVILYLLARNQSSART